MLRDLPKLTDANVIVGPETSDDAGVYRLTEDLAIVQTVDFFPPVVDDPFVYGQIAAANALSDVYAMGGTPKTALNLVGFPDQELPLSLLGRIIEGSAERLALAGAVILGGHSVRDAEIKFGLAVTGLIHPQQVLTNAGAQPGDLLVLTKPLGTGFVTTANKKGSCPAEVLAAAVQSMIQLNKPGMRAFRRVGVHAVTDVTGFGLAGHAFEMAQGSRVTIELHLAQLPLLPGVEPLVEAGFFTRARKSNRQFVDPGLKIEGEPNPVRFEIFLDAQTSGGLLVSLPEERVDAFIQQALAEGCLAAAVVGRVLPEQLPYRLIVRD